MFIIMLGKPGAGKGTVGKMLSQKLNIAHISSGDMFRKCIIEGNEEGKEIERLLLDGKLVPDELTIKIVEKRISEDDCENGAILDGFPRTIEQAKELDRFLKDKNQKIDMAIELDLTDQDIIDRITKRVICSNKNCREVYNLEFSRPKEEGICDVCGSKLEQRHDDSVEVVEKRLKTYWETTKDVIEYYKNKDVLYAVKLNIHSGKTSEDVVEDVQNYLSKNKN